MADEVYCDKHTNKFIIAGTYDWRKTKQQSLTLENGVMLYLRAQVEKTGMHEFKVLLVDKKSSPSADPILEMNGKLDVNDPHSIAHTGLRTVGFELKCPHDVTKIKKGEAIGLSLMWVFEMEGKWIASTPFTIFFFNPQGE